MTEKQVDVPKVTPSNTKKEILAAYDQIKKQFEEKAEQELQPEKKKQERQVRESAEVAEDAAAGSITEYIRILRNEISVSLSDIDSRIKDQIGKYIKIKEAISAKEQELAEIFDIERSAYTLATLLETNKQKREALEEEMRERREKLEKEIQRKREEWENELEEAETSAKEQKEQREKNRRREQEEYEYNLKREREQKTNALRDELNGLERELTEKKEAFDRKVEAKEIELKEREARVAQEEERITSLGERVERFPAELEAAVNKAVNETTSRLKGDAAKNEELLRKTFEGEKNVLVSRIDSLEQIIKEQKKQLESLSAQLEKAYGKVQDIAIKAVSGSRDRGRSDWEGTARKTSAQDE